MLRLTLPVVQRNFLCHPLPLERPPSDRLSRSRLPRTPPDPQGRDAHCAEPADRRAYEQAPSRDGSDAGGTRTGRKHRSYGGARAEGAGAVRASLYGVVPDGGRRRGAALCDPKLPKGTFALPFSPSFTRSLLFLSRSTSSPSRLRSRFEPRRTPLLRPAPLPISPLLSAPSSSSKCKCIITTSRPSSSNG